MQPGMTVGPYRIIEQIGLGGMATVFKAYDPGTDRYVAIKIVSPQFAQHPEFRERFRREAAAIAKLEHPHIIPVHAFGEEGETAYLVLRYMDTGTLRDRMNEHPMDLAEAGRFIIQIASALDYAHRNGVIHRDVKPANVLIDSEGNAYLTDFGIAKIVEATVELTGTGTAMGTPQYMSPEQCRGDKKLTATTDIYSLGVMMYQMVTGRVPFDAETPLAVIHQHLNDPLPPPRQINPQLSEDTEKVLLKALVKDPEDRYSTAADFAAAVRRSLRTDQTAEPVAPPSAIEPTALPQKATTELRSGIRRFWWVAALLGLLGLVGIFAISQLSDPLARERIEESAAVVDSATETPSQFAGVFPTLGIAVAEDTEAPAAPDFSSHQAISVNLGPENADFGLAQVEFEIDGITEPAFIGGREVRVAAPGGDPARYIYFHVDSSFIFGDYSEVEVSVEYFDGGNHVFGLDYDSADPEALIDGVYKFTDDVRLENTGQWRTATFHLSDALFADRQNGGADFRIATSDDDLYIDRVTVARTGSAIADAITDPWGHVFLRPGEPISIGVAAALGNPDVAALAADQVDAVHLAVDQYGPIHGFAIEIQEADSGCTAEGGISASSGLTSASNMTAIVGTSCTVAMEQAMHVFEGARVVFISPSATLDHLSQAGLSTFNRTAFPESILPDSVSFENDPDNPAYQDFAAAFEATYGRACCELSATQAYDAAVILLQAIEAVAVPDEGGSLVIPRQRLATVVRETRGFPGASGEINFDANGDRVLP